MANLLDASARLRRGVVERFVLHASDTGFDLRKPIRTERAGPAMRRVPALYVQQEKDMDASHYAGELDALGQLIRHVDLSRFFAPYDLRWSPYARAVTPAVVRQTIAQKNRARKNSLLRRRGIR